MITLLNKCGCGIGLQSFVSVCMLTPVFCQCQLRSDQPWLMMHCGEEGFVHLIRPCCVCVIVYGGGRVTSVLLVECKLQAWIVCNTVVCSTGLHSAKDPGSIFVLEHNDQSLTDSPLFSQYLHSHLHSVSARLPYPCFTATTVRSSGRFE